MDGICIDLRTKNVLAYVPDFVPRILAGKDATVLTEGKDGRKTLAFRCPCQPQKVKVFVREDNAAAKAVGEKLAAAETLQRHAKCASKTHGESSTVDRYTHPLVSRCHDG